MAEVAGLAIGGVALASLFSTCKDLFDYIDSSRNLSGDLEVAIIKLDLLRQRFKQWGEMTGVNNPAQGPIVWPLYWSETRDITAHSLSRIKTILRDASLLTGKYSGKQRGSGFIYHKSGSLPSSLSRAFAGTQFRLRLRCNLKSIRSRTIWAIHDKEKLDSWIDDLEFLLTNLERVGCHSAQPDIYTMAPLADQSTITGLTGTGESNVYLYPQQRQPKETSHDGSSSAASRPTAEGDRGEARSGSEACKEENQLRSAPVKIYRENTLNGNKFYTAGNVDTKEQSENTYEKNILDNNESFILGDTSLEAFKLLINNRK